LIEFDVEDASSLLKPNQKLGYHSRTLVIDGTPRQGIDIDEVHAIINKVLGPKLIELHLALRDKFKALDVYWTDISG
jgi:hypothetical protein